MMRYLSVCSGIEAATVAWHPLGWTPIAFSEIEAFPRALLGHHYPDVPLHGDFTTMRGDEYGPVDVLVGGTPCQDFSVAGLRAGIAGERGNLTLEFLRLAMRARPRWIVWENVPGILSSDDGRAFGAFLGGLGQLGYGFAYRVLDAQYFGLAQRRQRVFVVGCLGGWQRAAAVLFERESLRRDNPPRRQAGQAAPTIPARSTGGGGKCSLATEDGTGRGSPLVAAPLTFDWQAGGGGNDSSFRGKSRSYVTDPPGRTRAITANRTLAVAFDARQSDVIQYGDFSGPLDTCGHTIAIAFSAKDHGGDAGNISRTLRAGGHSRSHPNGGVMPAVAFESRFARNGRGAPSEIVPPLKAQSGTNGKGDSAPLLATAMMVRRLTPRECERLQGFPDDYTLVPYRGKPAVDGPRYKALGNSMAVPVMAWIGKRIALIDAM